MSDSRERVTFWRGSEETIPVTDLFPGRLLFADDTGNVYLDTTYALAGRKHLTDTDKLSRNGDVSNAYLTFTGPSGSYITISGNNVEGSNDAKAAWQTWLAVVSQDVLEDYLTKVDAAATYLNKNEGLTRAQGDERYLRKDVAPLYELTHTYLQATSLTMSGGVAVISADLSSQQGEDKPLPAGDGWLFDGFMITVSTGGRSMSNLDTLQLDLTILTDGGSTTHRIVSSDNVNYDVVEYTALTWAYNAPSNKFILCDNIAMRNPSWRGIAENL